MATAERAPPVDSALPTLSEAVPNEVPFPLNSRRLTVPYLKAIAKAVGLPTTGSADETRVMIDGKLEEMGRDPRNVQVIVASNPRGRETLSLRDVDGEFVRVGAVEEQEGVATGGGDREESESTTSEQSIPHSAGELDDLRERNATLSTSNADLAAKVSSLNEEVKKVSDKLKREAERMSEMWRMNCAQVAGFDEAITAKDSEIARLKARISELEARRPTSPAFLPASSPVRSVEPTHPPHSSHASVPTRRGKAPPVNEFSGDDPECLLDKTGYPLSNGLACGMHGQKRKRRSS